VELSGGERTRTADFYVANVALYQLSYTPVTDIRLALSGCLPFWPIRWLRLGIPFDQPMVRDLVPHRSSPKSLGFRVSHAGL
jgi:hypothetical protein